MNSTDFSATLAQWAAQCSPAQSTAIIQGPWQHWQVDDLALLGPDNLATALNFVVAHSGRSTSAHQDIVFNALFDAWSGLVDAADPQWHPTTHQWLIHGAFQPHILTRVDQWLGKHAQWFHPYTQNRSAHVVWEGEDPVSPIMALTWAAVEAGHTNQMHQVVSFWLGKAHLSHPNTAITTYVQSDPHAWPKEKFDNTQCISLMWAIVVGIARLDNMPNSGVGELLPASGEYNIVHDVVQRLAQHTPLFKQPHLTSVWNTWLTHRAQVGSEGVGELLDRLMERILARTSSQWSADNMRFDAASVHLLGQCRAFVPARFAKGLARTNFFHQARRDPDLTGALMTNTHRPRMWLEAMQNSEHPVYFGQWPAIVAAFLNTRPEHDEDQWLKDAQYVAHVCQWGKAAASSFKRLYAPSGINVERMRPFDARAAGLRSILSEEQDALKKVMALVLEAFARAQVEEPAQWMRLATVLDNIGILDVVAAHMGPSSVVAHGPQWMRFVALHPSSSVCGVLRAVGQIPNIQSLPWNGGDDAVMHVVCEHIHAQRWAQAGQAMAQHPWGVLADDWGALVALPWVNSLMQGNNTNCVSFLAEMPAACRWNNDQQAPTCTLWQTCAEHLLAWCVVHSAPFYVLRWGPGAGMAREEHAADCQINDPHHPHHHRFAEMVRMLADKGVDFQHVQWAKARRGFVEQHLHPIDPAHVQAIMATAQHIALVHALGDTSTSLAARKGRVL